ncbi:CysS/YqeB C-terminal domain-containing protein [Acidithrix ferrooxidans]|uniref:Cysteine--tRNA ligase n=1 Tax=Acidithrix ferrooxidans TaxID=1280514 RepID=A0A0D8HJ79_9ACTN|nr:hypothetical protein [Acidithrix ferrooxidans]KJF17914.1 cysteine--tRNA ligase [Acidithrix ferrooxidans]
MNRRILILLGSGETSPTMVKTHREAFSALPKNYKAVMLDTPFGFQENAPDISAKAIDYFRSSIGAKVTLASMRSATEASVLELENFANTLRDANYIFAGPGSPTYALSQWAKTPIASILEDKTINGGVVTFSSAAVLTLGRYTIPVYEIYKVGEAPNLRDGLNVLWALGLDVLVIPHFNNAEGNNHDTRYCYMGASRLRILESQMNATTAIVGIDEHTGIVIDLDQNQVEIVGLATVTIMRHGSTKILRAGDKMRFDEFSSYIREIANKTPAFEESEPIKPEAFFEAQQPNGTTSLLIDSLARHEERFSVALKMRNAKECLNEILELDKEIFEWVFDTLESDEIDKARTSMRSMISRLAPILENGFLTKLDHLRGAIEALVEVRQTSREQKRWSDSDLIRDRLASIGVTVTDTSNGQAWELKE